MKNTIFPLTRREFLRKTGGVGLLAFSGMAPSFLTRSVYAGTPLPEKDRTILVVIQLAGGNDGLNTVIPYTDNNYYRLRPKISIKKPDLVIRDELALHPSCEPLHQLLQEGKLSILQNVGYPNPNRSHFRSTEIWETASGADSFEYSGWLGRYIDNYCSGAPDSPDPHGIHVGDVIPQSFHSDEPHSIYGLRPKGRIARMDEQLNQSYAKLLESDHQGSQASYLQHTMMNAMVTERRVEKMVEDYTPMVSYPGNTLAQSLRRIAALIAADLETRVYFVSQSGYDTHVNQTVQHARLLSELSGALYAFQKDLDCHGKGKQVLTMTFSEFGRRPSENGSSGTDHGTAAPLFVLGGGVKGGVLGTSANLDLDPRQDIEYGIDFRRVYGTVLDQWLNAKSDKVLGNSYEPVPFLART